ncbi:probable protein phosphatase 2C 43 [Trifolium pratense]|uniref:probable protein phosphatase 2C 43 n=1 Tax=Trifolium pratense TaxID=57577 RepID=UPI001E692C5A|nr:probable protein phosphatase 2C 43 [Trifolium pratense]
MIPFLKHVVFGTPYQQYGQIEDPQAFHNDPLAWSRPLVKHYWGEFSMAAVQANVDMEDKCQVEVGIDSIFVGVYDGQKGDTVSILLRNHIFRQIIVLIQENNNNMNKNILERAVARIEIAFMRGTLYAANVGNSRAVLGSMTDVGNLKRLVVKQLVRDHNLYDGNIQKQVRNLQPDTNDDYNDKYVSMLFIRDRGLIDTTRCIGYSYLKEEISEGVEIPSWERM